MKIKIDTDELVKKEVISQQTADEIIQYYDSSKNTSTGKYALSVVAAIFVMTGVAILIADFWNDVGTNARICFSLFPIIVGSMACYLVDAKLSDKKIFTESVAILQGIAILTTFSMLCEGAFDLEIRKAVFFISVIILCFPFAIYFKATIAATVLTSFAVIFLAVDSADHQDVNWFLCCLTLAMDVFFLYNTYFKAKERFLLNIRLLISPFIITAFIYHFKCIFSDHNNFLVYSILTIISSGYAFSFLPWNKAKQLLETDAKWLELGAFLLSFIILTVGVAMHHYSSTDTIGWAIIIPFAAPLLLLWFIQKKNSIKIEFRQYFSLLAAIVVAITTPILEDHTSNIYVVLLLILLTYHTYQWRKNYNVIFFNIAMFCWIIAIYNISSVHDLGRAGVAVSIFVCGIILLALNYYLIKKKKDHELQNK